MSVALVYDDALRAYDLGPRHPLRPERFTLAVKLMRAYGLLSTRDAPATAIIADIRHIPDDDLLLVHDAAYVEAVKRAGADPSAYRGGRGIGPGDTPAFPGMHEASALVCSATATALDLVLDGAVTRSFSVAGGLHHAHRERAAGFCVYNDPAVAIARAVRGRGVRVAYVDIDAHHGDGVQEAFYDSAEVLTISVHESGRFLYPGSGSVGETGTGDGLGHAINVPLPPYADDACYRHVIGAVVEPALAAFRPDVIVAQCGADAIAGDPLTHLALSIAGHRKIVDDLVCAADGLCAGRIVATGGGGYDTFSAVPRAWCNVLAALLGVTLPEPLPETWRDAARAASGAEPPLRLSEQPPDALDAAIRDALLAETRRLCDRVRDVSPLFS